jgi:hypothetical protein
MMLITLLTTTANSNLMNLAYISVIQPVMTWCGSENVPEDRQSDPNSVVMFVRPGKLHLATRLLERETVRQLPKTVFQRLSNSPYEGQYRYYLTRSTLYVGAIRDVSSVTKAMNQASFVVKKIGSDGDILVVTLQPSDGSIVRAINFPIVVKTRIRVRHAYVGCFSVR